MKAIIATNTRYYIGHNGGLPWEKNKEDLKHFKNLTKNSRLLVGFRTFSTLPKLGNRTIILDVKDEFNFDVDWCIGGKATYEKYAPYFTELHISHINDLTVGDTRWPDFKNLNPNCKVFEYYF